MFLFSPGNLQIGGVVGCGTFLGEANLKHLTPLFLRGKLPHMSGKEGKKGRVDATPAVNTGNEHRNTEFLRTDFLEVTPLNW